MTRAETVREIEKYGEDASFVANLILNNQRRPAKKLKGMLELLSQRWEIRSAQFSIEDIVIGGKRFGYSVLESPKLVEVWYKTAEKINES